MSTDYEVMTVADLRHSFDAYLGESERIDEIAASLGLHEIGEGLRDIWFRLKQGPIRVLVTGCSSAGKSTLINALAKEIVVPEGKHTTSPIPVLIESRRADDCAHVEILRADSPHLPQHNSYGLYRFLTDFCYTQKESGQGVSERSYDHIISAQIRVGSSLLADAGVTLIDTPGIGMTASDDARVKKILDGGCEILIALFRDADIQQQHIKDFFCQLFVNDDAPLRSLLDSGRVFMVSNSGRSASMNELIGGHHLSADFGMDSSHLTVLNVRHARISSCGIYRYTNYLPETYSEEDWKYAEESTKEEKKSRPHPKAQNQLEAFCKCIRSAAENFCADTDAVAALMEPIQGKLTEAKNALESHLEVLRDRARAAKIDPPEEMIKRLDAANAQLVLLDRLEEDMKAVFEDPLKPFGIVWPTESNVFSVADVPDVALLLTSDIPSREKILLDLLMQNGAAAVTDKVRDRIPPYMDACSERVRTYVSEQLSAKIYERLLCIRDTLASILHDDVMKFMILENELQIRALSAGHAAMNETWSNAFPIEMQELSTAYLDPIRTKIQNGGIAGGWAKFTLYINYSVDILTIIAQTAAKNGKLAFVRAYRAALEAEKDMLYAACRAHLTMARCTANQEKKGAEDMILAYTEQVRAEMIARIDAYEEQMNTYLLDGGEMPHYEGI